MAAIEGKTAFVFSGGGSLGAIQVGMLRVLLSYELKRRRFHALFACHVQHLFNTESP